jgi:hypothetical protein
MTDTNKRLLISESCGDSNWCTPCRGKPDQHDTYASHASPRTPGVCFLRAVPVHGNLSWVIDRSHYSREKGLLTQSTARRLTDQWVRTQFLSQANQWSSRLKLSFCQWQSTRLTEPISPACDRYVQYMLTGANPSVLNWHSRGLQPWRCRLFTYHSPTFPTSYLAFPPKGPARSQVINQIITKWTEKGNKH